MWVQFIAKPTQAHSIWFRFDGYICTSSFHSQTHTEKKSPKNERDQRIIMLFAVGMNLTDYYSAAHWCLQVSQMFFSVFFLCFSLSFRIWMGAHGTTRTYEVFIRRMCPRVCVCIANWASFGWADVEREAEKWNGVSATKGEWLNVTELDACGVCRQENWMFHSLIRCNYENQWQSHQFSDKHLWSSVWCRAHHLANRICARNIFNQHEETTKIIENWKIIFSHRRHAVGRRNSGQFQSKSFSTQIDLFMSMVEFLLMLPTSKLEIEVFRTDLSWHNTTYRRSQFRCGHDLPEKTRKINRQSFPENSELVIESNEMVRVWVWNDSHKFNCRL